MNKFHPVICHEILTEMKYSQGRQIKNMFKTVTAATAAACWESDTKEVCGLLNLKQNGQIEM